MLSYDLIQQLAKTYNTLTCISTKGEDTIYMAKSLESLKDIYAQLNEIYREEISIDKEDIKE